MIPLQSSTSISSQTLFLGLERHVAYAGFSRLQRGSERAYPSGMMWFFWSECGRMPSDDCSAVFPSLCDGVLLQSTEIERETGG